ncbi:MAG: hypothetical protein ACLPX5_07635 [Dissulfurispiraceae bacterium]
MDHPRGLRTPIKHELLLERKKDFRDVDHGFTATEAMREASRCLRCLWVVRAAYEDAYSTVVRSYVTVWICEQSSYPLRHAPAILQRTSISLGQLIGF